MKIPTAVHRILLFLSLLFLATPPTKADEIVVSDFVYLHKPSEFTGTENSGLIDFKTVAIPKFNPALGELTSIEVTFSMYAGGEGGAISTNAVPGLWQFWSIGSVQVRNSDLLEVAWSAYLQASGYEFFNSSLSGSTGVPLYLASGTDEATVTASEYLENAIGTGDWYTLVRLETVQHTDQDDWDLYMWTETGLNVTVRYIYTPY